MRVHLEGPEFLSVPGTHTGACTYHFDFTVTIPGQYRVVAIAERADVDSMAEVFPTWGRSDGEHYQQVVL